MARDPYARPKLDLEKVFELVEDIESTSGSMLNTLDYEENHDYLANSLMDDLELLIGSAKTLHELLTSYFGRV